MSKVMFLILIFISVTSAQLRKEQFESYADTTEALRTKNLIPIDAANYIEVGGTLTGLINQIGIAEATLTISDTVTNTVSTIPSNITLNFTNEGLLVQSSGRMSVLGDVIAPIKKIFNGNVDLELSKVKEVYPEWWGARGNGTTNDAAALKTALTNGYGKRFVFTAEYKIEDSVAIDLLGRNMEWYFKTGSKIVSTAVTNSTNYYAPSGDIRIHNGNQLWITGGELYGNNNPAGGNSWYQNALFITDFNEVHLNNLNVKKGNYAGISIQNVEKFAATNCIVDSSDYAGLMIGGTGMVNVFGGSYSYNGDEGFNRGYGIICRGRFQYPRGETAVDSRNITINGVTANYNMRKGIDIHGGLNASITNNKVTGWGYGAIYALQEAPPHWKADDGYEAIVRNVVIANNVCEQDSAWWASINIDAGSKGYGVDINFGAFDSVGTNDADYSPGSFIITGNIIDCDSVPNRAAIGSYVNKSGKPIESIVITNNTIDKINKSNLNRHWAGIMVLESFYDPVVPPKTVIVSNNTLHGNGIYGIFVSVGNQIITNDNIFQGTFAPAVYAVCNSCREDTTFWVRSGNIHDKFEIPNMKGLTGYLTSDRYDGTITKVVTTTGSADTLNLFRLNVDEYTYGITTFHARIQAVGGSPTDRNDAIFEGKGYATRESPPSGTLVFQGDTCRLVSGYLNAASHEPTLEWMKDATRMPEQRYLRVRLPDADMVYNITLQFSSWRLSPYIFESQHELDSTGGVSGTTGWRNPGNDITERVDRLTDSVASHNLRLNVLTDSITSHNSRINVLTDSVKNNWTRFSSLSTNYIPYWSGTALANTIMRQSSSNFGIGIDPLHRLHVATDQATYAGYFLNTNNSAAGSGLYVETRYNTSDNYVARFTTNSGSNEVMALKGNGYVGIGTITPATQLDVNGVITATSGNSTQWNTAYSSLSALGSLSTYYLPYWNGTALANSGIYQLSALRFGFNTTTPEDNGNYTTLEVRGNDNDNGGIFQSTDLDGGTKMRFYSSYGDGLIGTTSNSALGFISNATARIWIEAAGSVGIGTTNPNDNAVLDLTSTTKPLLLPRMTTTEMNAVSSPVNGMIIYNSTDNKFYGYADGSWVALH